MTPEERAARSERRAVARRHHPDLGGDAAVFAEEMGRLDMTLASSSGPRDGVAPAPNPAGRPPTSVHRTVKGRAARLLRSTPTLVDRLRTRLPRSFPGSRRYGHL